MSRCLGNPCCFRTTGHPLRAPHLLGIALYELLHSERRIAGPYGMIFMRDRCSKQGHNTIAHNLVHGAFVAVHCGHHML
jgi:hypothetical protein